MIVRARNAGSRGSAKRPFFNEGGADRGSARGRPSVSPRPLRIATPVCIASAAVALGATVASDALLQPFFEPSLVQRIGGAGMAAFFGVAGTRWALARGASEWNALRGSALTGAVVLSWFMVCDRLATMHASIDPDPLTPLLLPLVLVVVAALGATVGTLFGLTSVAVVRPAERGSGAGSLDAPERALLPASVWLGAWGLALVGIRHPRSAPALCLVVLGIAGLAYVTVRDAKRLLFLRELFDGRSSELRVVRFGSGRSEGAIPPPYGPHAERLLDGALAPRDPPGGPYRAAPPELPIARIPLSREAAIRPFRRRIAITSAIAIAMIAAAAARLDVACLSW